MEQTEFENNWIYFCNNWVNAHNCKYNSWILNNFVAVKLSQDLHRGSPKLLPNLEKHLFSYKLISCQSLDLNVLIALNTSASHSQSKEKPLTKRSQILEPGQGFCAASNLDAL